jgi:hypothetical protein
MDRNYLDNQEEDRSLGAALDRMHKKLSEAEAYTSVANQALDKIEADIRKDRMGIVSNYLAGSSDGDFLKAQNIPQGKEMHLTIANIEMRNNLFPDEHGKGEDKLIATFVETRQATGKQAEMVLNVTNTRTLVEAWGEDESTWMGKARPCRVCASALRLTLRTRWTTKSPFRGKKKRPANEPPQQQPDTKRTNPMTKKDQARSLPAPVSRTSSGLRDAIFDELDALRQGKSTPARANAVARLGSGIVEIVRLELDVEKHQINRPKVVNQNGDTEQASFLAAPLKLGQDDE